MKRRNNERTQINPIQKQLKPVNKANKHYIRISEF